MRRTSGGGWPTLGSTAGYEHEHEHGVEHELEREFEFEDHRIDDGVVLPEGSDDHVVAVARHTRGQRRGWLTPRPDPGSPRPR